MTSMDVPGSVWGTKPIGAEIREAVQMDRTVAVVAIACATVVILGALGVIALVADRGGDTGVVAGAIGLAVGAIIKPIFKLVTSSKGKPAPETTSD